MNIDIATIPDIGKEPLDYVLESDLASREENELWLEFGVWKGATVNKMAKATKGLVYGFDSFEGLPEDWRPGFAAGAFNEDGKLPLVEANVRLIKGWFEDTLEQFLVEHCKKTISLLHIDCDIYSASRFVLFSVAPFLKPGSVVVFDELINYPGYDDGNGELRALREFAEAFSVEFEWIGMNGKLGQIAHVHEKVALVINGISA